MTVGILGLGLIGGSMARAYSKAGHSVLAAEKDKIILEFAELAGVISGELNSDTIPNCDLILLCTFAKASANWLENHAHKINY